MRNRNERADNQPYIDTGARAYRKWTGIAVLAAGAAFAAWALNQNSGESVSEQAPIAGSEKAGE